MLKKNQYFLKLRQSKTETRKKTCQIMLKKITLVVTLGPLVDSLFHSFVMPKLQD